MKKIYFLRIITCSVLGVLSHIAPSTASRPSVAEQTLNILQKINDIQPRTYPTLSIDMRELPQIKKVSFDQFRVTNLGLYAIHMTLKNHVPNPSEQVFITLAQELSLAEQVAISPADIVHKIKNDQPILASDLQGLALRMGALKSHFKNHGISCSFMVKNIEQITDQKTASEHRSLAFMHLLNQKLETIYRS